MAAITRIFHVAAGDGEPGSRRGTLCMMHVYVGVTPCVYLSLSLPLSVCACMLVCGCLFVRYGAWKSEMQDDSRLRAWGAVPFECQRQLPRILDASSSVLNAPAWVSSMERRSRGKSKGCCSVLCVRGIRQNVRALCMSIN